MSLWGRRAANATPRVPARVPPGMRALAVRAARLPTVPNGTRVRMYGIARGAERLLTSPVMQRPCIAYRLVVEEPGWRQVLESAEAAPFLLQDEDVVVSVRGPFEVVLQRAYEWEFGSDVHRRIAHLLNTAPVQARDCRYYEALIQPGDRVSIEGFASVAVDPAGERAALRAPPLLYTVGGTLESPAVIAVPEPGSVAP